MNKPFFYYGKDMSQLNLLTIGLALKHTEHISSLQRLQKKGVRIIGVCNSDFSQAVKVSELLSSSPVANVQEAIRELTVNAAFVCLPHYAYSSVLPMLIKRNIHILKEKPFAMDINDAITIKNQLETSSSKFMVVAQRRFHTTYTKAKKLLPSLGNIQLINTHYNLNRYAEGWRKKTSLAGGGVILDSGYHMLDILNWFFGLPKSVSGMTSLIELNDAHSTEDNAILLLKYPQGYFANLSFTRTASTKSESVTIYGSKGEMKITRNSLKIRYKTQREINFYARPNWNTAMYKQHTAFIKMIKGQNKLNPSTTSAWENALVIEASYLSSKSEKTIQIPKLITHYESMKKSAWSKSSFFEGMN